MFHVIRCTVTGCGNEICSNFRCNLSAAVCFQVQSCHVRNGAIYPGAVLSCALLSGVILFGVVLSDAYGKELCNQVV